MRRHALSWGCLFVLVLIYLFCPFRLGIVCGASMEPTFRHGQPILVDRGYYRRQPVEQGDVILLHQDGQTLIKRVFACAGDTFHVLICTDESGIYRYIVPEEQLNRARNLRRVSDQYRLSRIRVPKGFIYVLGDNSSASIDSRDFGVVPLANVIGHVADRAPENGATRTAEAAGPTRERRAEATLDESGGTTRASIETATTPRLRLTRHDR